MKKSMEKPKTDELVREFLIRLSDWFEDPEPQHDEYFASVNQGSLEIAYRALMNCERFQNKKVPALLRKKD